MEKTLLTCYTFVVGKRPGSPQSGSMTMMKQAGLRDRLMPFCIACRIGGSAAILPLCKTERTQRTGCEILLPRLSVVRSE
jgi:hypothetical protein